MAVIAPTILTANPEEYKSYIERLYPFAKRVHIDFSDGEFAPTFTLSPDRLWWPKEWTVDIHAMVTRPGECVDQLIALKPNMIIFHAEAQADLPAILRHVKQAGIKAGLALLRPTVPITVQPAIQEADHVMIFTGNLGQYGGTASLMQLEKVRLIKQLKADLEIGWDGGVRVDNAFTLKQGGVDVLNVGATLARSDNPADVYKKLEIEINKTGII